MAVVQVGIGLGEDRKGQQQGQHDRASPVAPMAQGGPAVQLEQRLAARRERQQGDLGNHASLAAVAPQAPAMATTLVVKGLRSARARSR